MSRSLLLTAVASVAVPGVLALLAVLGHEHVAAQVRVSAMVPDSPVLSRPPPVTAATERDGLSHNVAALQQASAAPVTVFSRVTVGQETTGVSLLDQAAKAGLATSYQGTEMVVQTGVTGNVTMISQVWHQGGGQTVVSSCTSSDVTSGTPEGVFGVTTSLVALLGKHYVAAYSGGGTAVGRAAAVVELYRSNGSLAARYWLDRKTMVPLRRELLDTSGNVVSEDSFVQVTFGAPALLQFAGAAAPQPEAQQAWVAAVAPARFLASLDSQGWQVPGTLPDGLPLYAAASATTTNGEVADLQYSDGLYVVSLFVQRGTLAPDLSGWRQVSLAGQQAYVSGHSVTWAGPGFVYTMIADAPPQTVTRVVGALPRSGSPSILTRFARGFNRLAWLVNPFG